MFSTKMSKNQQLMPGTCAGVLPEIAEITEPKRILVTGRYPYAGKSFARFMHRWPDTYQADMFPVKKGCWKKADLSEYDAVLYTGMAGSCEKLSGNYKYSCERDAWRAVKTADLAKKAGVKMFLYLSTLHVYGTDTRIITEKTPVCPSDICGKAGIYAEKELWKQKDASFHVAILRLPPIYGYEYGGQYRKIANFAVRHGFFPKYGQKRSMIHIDNLSSAVRGILCCERSGVYFPQDADCVSAYEMARAAAEFHGRKFKETKLWNPLIWILAKRSQAVKEMFLGYVCDQSLNVPEEWREVKSIRQGVRIAESGW